MRNLKAINYVVSCRAIDCAVATPFIFISMPLLLCCVILDSKNKKTTKVTIAASSKVIIICLNSSFAAAFSPVFIEGHHHLADHYRSE
jgi:hypothetical protein